VVEAAEEVVGEDLLGDAELMARSGGSVSHPVLRPKLDAHRMYAQYQVVIHMTRI
jgi:hypothetical protein